jgi:hypothetical protein
MTDRREDDGYAVAPVRLGDGGSRSTRGRRRLAVVGVAVAGCAIFGLAIAGPRLNDRPNLDVSYFATPTPISAATSSLPTPPSHVASLVTPLPVLTRPSDATAIGRFGIVADGFRVLDLNGGTTSSPIATDPASDAIISVARGEGWICVCASDLGSGEPGIAHIINLDRIRFDGTLDSSVGVVPFDLQDDPAGVEAVQTDVVAMADRRSALIAVASERRGAWVVSLSRIDLLGSRIGAPLTLGRLVVPAATPTGGTGDSPEASAPATPGQDTTGELSVTGPAIRLSPDGGAAVVMSTASRTDPNGVVESLTSAWRVDLAADGTPVEAHALAGLSDLPQYCSGMGFASKDRFAALCADLTSDLATWTVSEIDAAGSLTGRQILPDTSHAWFEPLFDTANGVIWAWNPADLALFRIDAENLGITSQVYDPNAESAPGAFAFGGRQPVWSASESAVAVTHVHGIAGAPDGSRLYLEGDRQTTDANGGAPASLGVYVVDPASFALIAHWPADAAVASITPTADGSMVAVAGLPGLDPDGNAAPWEGSLTFHRVSDGRVEVQFGRLGTRVVPILLPS